MAYECNICKGTTFVSQEALRRHRSNKHSTNATITIDEVEYAITIEDGRHCCSFPECKKSYEGRDGLRKHMKKVHCLPSAAKARGVKRKFPSEIHEDGIRATCEGSSRSKAYANASWTDGNGTSTVAENAPQAHQLRVFFSPGRTANAFMNNLEANGLTSAPARQLLPNSDCRATEVPFSHRIPVNDDATEPWNFVSSIGDVPASFPSTTPTFTAAATSPCTTNSEGTFSSSIGSPFDSSTWVSRPRTIGQPSTFPTTPAREIELHPFETHPSQWESPPDSSALSTRLPDHRSRGRQIRQFLEVSSVVEESPRLWNQERLQCRGALERSEDQDQDPGDFIVHDSASPSTNTHIVNLDDAPMEDSRITLRGNIRAAIQTLVGNPDAREKSMTQMLGIEAVMRGQKDAIITMRTGGGKSMLWLVPVLLDPRAKFLVVCPFAVLLSEQFQKAKAHGIKAVEFSRFMSIPQDVQILFVQVEHIASVTFHTMLASRASPKFTALFVDEHHDQLGCPPDRRVAWQRLAEWASTAVMPIVLLSATAPPSLTYVLLRRYGLQDSSTEVIRGSTDRPEIGLHAIHLSPTIQEQALVQLVSALLGTLKGDERMLVFFNSCQKVQKFAHRNEFSMFHSKLSKETKGSNLSMWDDGRTKVMACTSAFATGVDRPNVRFIIIHEPSYGFMTTVQMAGRAGRDGRESHVFLTTAKKPPSVRKPDDFNMAWELGQLMHKRRCRVHQVMLVMDGDTLARECDRLPGQVRCDVCEPNGEMHQFATRAVKPSQN